MKNIQINTPIPGPNATSIIKRRQEALPRALGRSTDVVMKSAKGALVTDVDGNQLLDFAGGIGMLNLGHRPDIVVDAVKEQLDKYIHSCNVVATVEKYVELAELLNSLTPGDFPKKTIVGNSGTEVVENALMISKYHTGRNAIICFEGAYHGRSMLSLSVTSKYPILKKGFGSFASDIYRLPVPNLYRKPNYQTDEQHIDECIQSLHRAFTTQVDPSSVAAIIIEPIIGEGGFIPMPKEFLQNIREICDKYGIVFIVDEIQSGASRTGKFLAIEHSDIVPDMVTMAKSIGSGFQVSALTGKAEIMDKPHIGGLGGTYGGSPVSCTAAIETLKQVTSKEFLEKSVELGKTMDEILYSWKEKYDVIGDIRGVGAMKVIEFVKDKKSKEPASDFTLSVIKESVSNGVILIKAGLYGNCIRLLPPIVITKEQLEEGLSIIEIAIKNSLSKKL